MAERYALVSPENVVSRVEHGSRVDPGVLTKPGWRWLPYETSAPPSVASPIMTAVSSEIVGADNVVKSWSIVPREPTSKDVNAERNRRLTAFTFAGHAYDFDPDSQTNISGVGVLSLAAIINGATPGDLRWADAEHDFTWIDASNERVPMDAQTCFAFAQAAAAWKSAHIRTARAIKDLAPIPADYAADARWPS